MARPQNLLGSIVSCGLIFGLTLILSSGCTPGRTLEFSPLRLSPDHGARESFIQSQPFKAAKTPNIYILFFDTLRPDYAYKIGGAFKAFHDESLPLGQSYCTGTATWYSMYSFFHGVPAFVTYDSVGQIQSDPANYGSVFLKVFSKLGYQIHSFGFGWGCDPHERTSGTSWKRFLTAHFGWKTQLIDRCKSDPTYDQIFDQNEDEVLAQELETKLPLTIQNPGKNLTFAAFYNVHYPYKWGSVTEGINDNVGPRPDFSNPRITANRYFNSIVASDSYFKRVLTTIRSLPGNEDAVIVAVSDHGEMLSEKNRETGHGGIPYKEKIEIVLDFHFPPKSGVRAKAGTDALATLTDVFPTLLDYVGATPELDKLEIVGDSKAASITGKSLLSDSRDSTVIIRTNMESPTREMVLVNSHEKAWIEVDEDDFYHSKSFRLKGFTDLEDRRVNNPCELLSDRKCKKLLMKRFKDAMMELYPDYQLEPKVTKKNGAKLPVRFQEK